MRKLIIVGLLFFPFWGCSRDADLSPDSFGEVASPLRVGHLIAERFIREPFSQYGSPLRASEPRTQVTYPDVCAWVGALWYARNVGDTLLLRGLEDKFQPLFGEMSGLLPKKNHVDNNVFGAVPLELYSLTGDDRYRVMGLEYADSQWRLPDGWVLVPGVERKNAMYGDAADADICQIEQKEWNDRGFSWQTRFWLDDMFMITALQSQAYKITGDREYIDRAAREMVLYLEHMQRENGLFDHGPGAPFAWSRGNGWMAVGMTEVLRALPADNECYGPIMESYRRMMSTLVSLQSPEGMWRQVVDDSSMWEESSGSAMFTYALIIGVRNGWLQPAEYAAAARKGWMALCSRVDEAGAVSGVCEGTMLGDNSEHYRQRRSLVGDVHGQAPMLWCAAALLSE